MAYASIADFRSYMTQVADGAEVVTSGVTVDQKIQAVLDRATQIIDTEIGYSFAAAEIGTRIVYGDGSDYLFPPAFVAGSVTAVTTIDGYDAPDYIEQEGALVVSRSSLIGPSYYDVGAAGYPYRLRGGWIDGVPYTVAANFGYAAPPADIVECCLEIAVRIWRAADAGFSDVIGVGGDGGELGGGVGYNGQYPALVKRILANYRNARSRRGIY